MIKRCNGFIRLLTPAFPASRFIANINVNTYTNKYILVDISSFFFWCQLPFLFVFFLRNLLTQTQQYHIVPVIGFVCNCCSSTKWKVFSFTPFWYLLVSWWCRWSNKVKASQWHRPYHPGIKSPEWISTEGRSGRREGCNCIFCYCTCNKRCFHRSRTGAVKHI